MTPAEQAAREILKKLATLCGCHVDELWPQNIDKIALDWTMGAIAAALRQARREEREAYTAIFDYAVNSQAAHHSEVCDCGLCRAIAAIRARAQEGDRG